jgi:arylsulfatase A-like enzyme
MHSQPNKKMSLPSLSVVFLPLFLLLATMKIQRGIALGSVDSIGPAFVYVLVEISIFLLFTSVLYALTVDIRQRFWLGVGLLTLYLLTACAVLVEIATHELFRQTGLILNWPQFLFGFERTEMVLKALEQQVSTSTKFYLSAALLYLILLAALLIRQLRSIRVEHHRYTGVGFAAVCLFTYIGLLIFSATFGYPREEFRGATSHFFISYFESKPSEQKNSVAGSNDPNSFMVIPAGASLSNKINIAVIILESTRRDSVAPYVDTEVTPYFAELAENSLLAERAYSTTPHTSRAIYSILCGRFPRSGKGIVETLKNGIKQACLPHLLTQQGYTSAFFQSATEDFENREQLVVNMGFSEFFPLEEFDTTEFEKSNYFGYEDNIMLPASEDWLTQRHQPFLAAYLTVTPHFHYDAISRYGWKNYVNDKKYNAYLNTLHYQDNFLKNLIQQYKDLGLYQNTLFVILGDHGEAFREHRLWGHGNILYEEGVKVPLLLHYADRLAGRVTPRVSLLDVVPSILGQMLFDGPGDFFPGQDLQQPVEARDILLECISPNQCSSLIDAETGLKVIHNYQRKPDGLYDLSSDPQELIDLADHSQYQAIKQNLLTRLQGKIDEIRATEVPRTYSSWAYNSRPVIWMKDLPDEQVSFQNQFKIDHLSGNTGILRINASKDHVFAGDSFNLSYTLSDPGQNICVVSVFEGIKRHKRRTHDVETLADAEPSYFQVTENLQVQPGASNILMDISTKTDCSTDAEILSRNQLVIELPEKDNGDVAFSSKYNQLFQRQPLISDVDTLQSTVYLNELLDPQLPVDAFSINSVPTLRSAEFVEGIRGNISRLQDQYGGYQYSRLDSVWESKDGGSTLIYRYQSFFSNNLSMDFRVITRDSRIVALYYYHPWNRERPL